MVQPKQGRGQPSTIRNGTSKKGINSKDGAGPSSNSDSKSNMDNATRKRTPEFISLEDCGAVDLFLRSFRSERHSRLVTAGIMHGQKKGENEALHLATDYGRIVGEIKALEKKITNAPNTTSPSKTDQFNQPIRDKQDLAKYIGQHEEKKRLLENIRQDIHNVLVTTATSHDPQPADAIRPIILADADYDHLLMTRDLIDRICTPSARHDGQRKVSPKTHQEGLGSSQNKLQPAALKPVSGQQVMSQPEVAAPREHKPMPAQKGHAQEIVPGQKQSTSDTEERKPDTGATAPINGNPNPSGKTPEKTSEKNGNKTADTKAETMEAKTVDPLAMGPTLAQPIIDQNNSLSQQAVPEEKSQNGPGPREILKGKQVVSTLAQDSPPPDVFSGLENASILDETASDETLRRNRKLLRVYLRGLGGDQSREEEQREKAKLEEEMGMSIEKFRIIEDRMAANGQSPEKGGKKRRSIDDGGDQNPHKRPRTG